MSFSYPIMEYWLLIPKLFNVILFAAVAFKILSLKRYKLNRLFFGAFLMWAFYILAEAIFYITGANSLTAFKLANYARDIQMIFAVMVSYCFYYASNIIKEGEAALNKKKFRLIIIPFLIAGFLLAYFDGITVFNANGEIIAPETLPPTGEVYLMAKVNLPTILFSLFPIVFFIISLVILYSVIRTVSDPLRKKKMMYMFTGIFLIPFVVIFYIIINFIGIYSIFTSVIGHIFWAMAPIFVWLSQKNPKKD